MILAVFTLFHVLISLIGIGTGFIAILGLVKSKRLDNWIRWFLVFTIGTSVTGYFFPVQHVMPSHIVGLLSLIALLFACLSFYKFQLAGAWRKTFVITSVIAQFFNCFVLVVQLFAKVPAIRALAPTQSEPPFAIAQGVLLLGFLVLGYRATKNFQIPAVQARATRA